MAPGKAEAKHVGEVYASARSSQRFAIQELHLCGGLLAEIRGLLPHGEWELWCKEHQAALGFTVITARRLIRLANRSLAIDMTEEQAVEVSRQVWGHELEVAPSAPTAFSVPYRRITGFLDWISKHPVADIPDAELIELKPRIEAMRQWIAELEGKAKRLNLRIAS